MNGKSGLQRTFSVGSVHCPPDPGEPLETERKKLPQDIYSIYKDIVIENQAQSMWKRYSSKKKPKYYEEMTGNEISVESNCINKYKEIKTDLVLNIVDIVDDITKVERNEFKSQQTGNNESIPNNIQTLVHLTTENSTHARS